jgi:hypothetical protein
MIHDSATTIRELIALCSEIEVDKAAATVQ